MPDHDTTQPPGEDPSLTASAPSPGTEPNADDSPTPHRGPRFHLGAFAVPKFGRKKAVVAPEAEAAAPEGAAPAAEGYGLGPDPEGRPRRRRLPKVAWHKMPLANARRETRVGVAALASFLILVVALLLNRGGKTRDARPGDPSASGTLLALGGDDNPKGDPEPKDDPEPKTKPKGDPVPPSRPQKTASPVERPAATGSTPQTKGAREVVLLPAPQAPAGDPPTRPADAPLSTPRPTPDVASPTPVETAAPPLDPPPSARPVLDTPPVPPVAAPSPTTDELPSMPTIPPTSTPTPVTVAGPPPSPSDPDPRGATKPLGPAGPSTTPAAAPIDVPNPEPAVSPGGGPTLPAPSPSSLGPSPAPPIDPVKPSEPGPDPIATPPLVPDPAAGPKPADTLPKADPIPVPVIEPSPAPAAPGSPEASPRTGTARPLTSTPAPDATALPAADPTPSRGVPAFTRPPIESDPPNDIPGGRAVRNLGRKRMPEPEAEARLAPEKVVADAPLPREEVGAREQVDPILHTVESGENFWTISRTYYGSGRYYRALHVANRRLVPKIDELYVGTTIKVPPVESLDPRSIDPPSRSTSTDDSTTRASRSSSSTASRPPRSDGDRAVPSQSRGEIARSRPDPDEPTRPTYRVRLNETLRGIARDTLGDSHRYKEILQLNRDVIDDPSHLPAGLVLTLPEDAVVRSR